MAVTLKPHQVVPLWRLSNGKVLCGGVGSGKSVVAIAYYWTRVCGGTMRPFKIGNVQNHPIIIITTARKRESLEWEGDLAMFGLNKVDHPIIVDSWNNIKKYSDRKGCFFVFDEQRVVGYGTWATTFIDIARNNQWILLSATPGDVWKDYMAVFIANGFYKNKSDFEFKHVIYKRFAKYPQIDRYIDEHTLEKYRKEVLIFMPMVRPTTRIRKDIRVEFDKDLFETMKTKRFDIWNECPYQNGGALWSGLRHISSQDPSRAEKVLEFARKHNRVIVFYNFDYELEALREATSSLDGFVVAEYNGHKHEEVPTTEKWVYLVNYASGAEAWNCITTNAMIFYSLNYSYRVMEQAEGRIDRMNTPYTELYYYYLTSDSMVDKAVSAAIRSKKIFNEKAFLGLHGMDYGGGENEGESKGD